MPAKPRLTEKGLLAESFGRRPYTVTLREEKEPGSNVLLDFTAEDGRRPKPTLGYPVRIRSGKRWIWDDAALQRARDAAEDKAAEIRLQRLRTAVQAEPAKLTVAQAWALFHDPERGAMPQSRSSRAIHKRARRIWTDWLKPSTPWNRIQRSDVDALMRKYVAGGQIPTGIKYVEVLRTLFRWLDDKTDYEGMLKDPTKKFDWLKYRSMHRPRRPPFTTEQAAAILRVRHQVDPRFALLAALIDDSGTRRKAVLNTWRSGVNGHLDMPPTAAHAPDGWILFPGLKRQDDVLHFLTPFEAREIEMALHGYLAELEAEYQRSGRDYPLFPGVRLADMKVQVVRPEQRGADRAASESLTEIWLDRAEQLAKVDHVDGRGYHGLRRGWANETLERTDMETLTVSGGWSSQQTPEKIYVEKKRHKARARARQAMVEKRRIEEENDGES